METAQRVLERAAAALTGRSALLVTAGAGMGVDSGLPDFRGNEGFWRAYPPYAHLGLRFDELADPRWFHEDPEFAWGFYGHRLQLYRDTLPHAGFAQLRKLATASTGFALTSNIDGHFQRARWDDTLVWEVHGSIHWFQCVGRCSNEVWSADCTEVEVDPETFRARGALPRCPRCGALARPNVLMFGDWDFSGARAQGQEEHFEHWLSGVVRETLVVVEIGAGTAIPTVRLAGERLLASGAQLIRINPRESHGPEGTISLPMGGLAALEAIAAVI